MPDIFSGRPNPQWPLTASESAELLARVRALESPAISALGVRAGWRGFVVLVDGPLGRESAWLRVRGGVVEVQGRVFRDTAGIESLLAAQARRHGLGALLDEVRAGANP
jgi:hypothetical protein